MSKCDSCANCTATCLATFADKTDFLVCTDCAKDLVYAADSLRFDITIMAIPPETTQLTIV